MKNLVIKHTLQLLFLAIFMLPLSIASGQNRCPEKYDMAMAKGKTFLRQGNIGQAIKEFQAAQFAARECKLDVENTATELLQGAFARLQKELKAAEIARNEAVASREKAERALETAEKARALQTEY